MTREEIKLYLLVIQNAKTVGVEDVIAAGEALARGAEETLARLETYYGALKEYADESSWLPALDCYGGSAAWCWCGEDDKQPWQEAERALKGENG